MADETPVTTEVVSEAVVETPTPAVPETTTPEAGSFYSGNVPKELEGPYKEMQASFTRQQQALSRERMSLRGQGSQTPPLATSPQGQVTEATEADPYAGQIGAMEGQMREIRLELMNTQIDRFAETHKDVYEHAAEMADMMLQVPNLSMDKAYWAVKGPKAEQAGRASAMQTFQQKITTNQAGPIGKTNVPAAPKVYKSIADAAADAYNSVASQEANR